MKKIIYLFILLFSANLIYGQGYNIKVSIPKMSGKEVILANYLEGKVYSVDTVKLNSAGTGAFIKKNNKLARGMYLLLFSKSNYFDMLIGDQQNFSVALSDTLNILNNIRFEGSAENQAFLDFQKYMVAQNTKTKQIRERFDKDPNKDKAETQRMYSDQFKLADKEVREYIANISERFPNSAIATFTNFTLSPTIPDFSKEVPEGTKDRNLEIQKRAYFYNREHYWDYTNFKDSTLIRTPIFKNKLDDYFSKMLPQHPDTIFKEAVKVIEKARTNKAMFRYLVSYAFNYSLESKIMGMDAAFVNIAKRYYLTGQATWMDEENLKKIEREVALTQYNLIGMKAQELKLPTLEGNWVSLHETKAPFTILLFWEYNCGHCKKTVPQIKTQLLDKFKQYGLKVFAVHIQNDKESWEKFVADNDLFDFINVWDPHNQSNFRLFYHIESTPIIYLLDKDKKFIAKKLDVEQLSDMLIREYKKMGVDVK